MGEREKPTEAEQSVLGAVLMDSTVLPIVVDLVRADDFTDPRHRVIWLAIIELARAFDAVDEVTVLSRLKQQGKVEACGGPLYVAQLVERVPSIANVEHYAEIVRKAATVRQLYKASREAMKAIEDGADTGDVFAQLETTKAAIEAREPDHFGDLTDHMDSVLAEMEKRHEAGQVVSAESFVTTGYPSIDRKLIGLAQSALIIVSAESGVGKTALVINWANRQALAGLRVGFFSGEMTCAAIARRSLSSAARVDHHVLRKGILAADDWPRAMAARASFKRARFLINDEITTVAEVCSMAHRAHLHEPFDVIYVDYLQHLVDDSSGNKNDNRERMVAKAAKDLKNLSRKLRVPVVVLSQLNTDGSLRESKAIYHTADVVLKVFRPGASNTEADQHEATLKIEKNRDGAIGHIPLLWRGEYVRFDEIDAPYKSVSAPTRASWLETTEPG